MSLTGIASATDICDPNPTVTNNAPAQFPVGSTTVTFTATDHSGNSAQKTLTVHVVYNFIGYFTPILNDGSAFYHSGRTVPVKFQLTAADGSIVSNAVANIQVFQVLSTPSGTVDMSVDTTASGSSNTGTLFRFDPTSNQYIYNLNTGGYASGTYLLRTTLNDGTTHDVQFSIK
ncbi:MAG: PxKF domain-containing protein [Candidatus Acidiferrales bacterium]